MSCQCNNFSRPHQCLGCDYNCDVKMNTNEACKCTACQSLKGYSFGQLPVGSTTIGVYPWKIKNRPVRRQ